MTCKLNADTTDGLKLTSDTSGEIDLQIDGTTKVHMASDGNLGVNTTSPASKLHIHGSFRQTGATAPFEWTVNAGSLDYYKLNAVGYADNLIVADSGGNVYFGTVSSAPWTATSGTFARIGTTFPITATAQDSICAIFNRNTGDGAAVELKKSGTVVGSISVTASNTAYNTSSDYRLKENVDYSFDATTRLKQLKPCRFNFIADESNTLVDGFIAHEVSSIVPEAITGEKDATKVQDVYNDDGVKTGTETVPDYQGIDQSKLVPLLVKTIQELEARITALENN